MASKFKKIVNVTAGSVVAERARVADTFIDRLTGLLLSPPLEPGQGLLIVPCSAIHMFGMKFAIDAVFLDKQNRVVGVINSIAPGQVSSMYPSARACLELPAGAAAETNTKLGDQLQITDQRRDSDR